MSPQRKLCFVLSPLLFWVQLTAQTAPLRPAWQFEAGG